MKKYKAITPVILKGGRVKLNKDQARRRQVQPGIHEVKTPWCLKAGEIFEYDGPLPKLCKMEVISNGRGRPKKSADSGD